ncbi:hypothetical protein T02_4029 [Trichinella nativa]|uniref:Uncharacterized protein n=1 Tax=Trichinella nativa TaxID=6335 RepID=A0A0V1LGS7_9BILA|nr:hypothetical protein T02_4029 [Trichinella nativa]
MVVGLRCAVRVQWRFQCDDGRRIAIKMPLYRRIEDENGRPIGRGGFPHLNVFTSHALSS